MPEKDKRFVIVCFSVEPKKEKKRSKREKAPMLWKQKVEWWLPGAGGEANYCVMGMDFAIEDVKSTEDWLTAM